MQNKESGGNGSGANKNTRAIEVYTCRAHQQGYPNEEATPIIVLCINYVMNQVL